MTNSLDLKKVFIAALATSAAGLVSACGVGQASATDEAEQAVSAPLPVEVVLPMKSEIFATYHTTTTISSDADAPVPARVSGEVVDILVEEGDEVVQGQILARLDGQRLRLEMEQARASLEMATREYDRTVNLHERGLVSSTAFDGMKFDMESLQATYELKRLYYEYSNIRAPIAGVVSARDIKLGQHLNANDISFRVTDTRQLVAHLKIPQSELARITTGHTAEIRVDAMPEQIFVATISRVSPTIDARNGTFRATAYVDNESGLLAPGMFSRFAIAYEKHEDALTIPAAAVIEEDNESVVYIVTDGAAERRVIRTGIRSNGIVEVLGGIDQQDQIVVTGQSGIRDGSRVLASVPTRTTVSG
jgi:membrane fusion protein (multidrug efflux system)